MADIASSRVSRSDVVRVRRAVEVPQVAGHAGRAGQLVISINVTLRTLQRRVGAREWEPGAGVIEAGACP